MIYYTISNPQTKEVIGIGSSSQAVLPKNTKQLQFKSCTYKQYLKLDNDFYPTISKHKRHSTKG